MVMPLYGTSPIDRYGHYCQRLQDLDDEPEKLLASRTLQIGPDNWEDMVSSHPDPTGDTTTSTDPHHVPSVHGFLTTLQDDRVQRRQHNKRSLAMVVYSPLAEQFQGPLLKECYDSWNRPLQAAYNLMSPRYKIVPWPDSFDAPSPSQGPPAQPQNMRLSRYIAAIFEVFTHDPTQNITRFGTAALPQLFRDAFDHVAIPYSIGALEAVNLANMLRDHAKHLATFVGRALRAHQLYRDAQYDELDDADLLALSGIVLIISKVYSVIVTELTPYLRTLRHPDLENAPWPHPVYMAREIAQHFTQANLQGALAYIQGTLLPLFLREDVRRRSAIRFYGLMAPDWDPDGSPDG